MESSHVRMRMHCSDALKPDKVGGEGFVCEAVIGDMRRRYALRRNPKRPLLLLRVKIQQYRRFGSFAEVDLSEEHHRLRDDRTINRRKINGDMRLFFEKSVYFRRRHNRAKPARMHREEHAVPRDAIMRASRQFCPSIFKQAWQHGASSGRWGGNRNRFLRKSFVLSSRSRIAESGEDKTFISKKQGKRLAFQSKDILKSAVFAVFPINRLRYSRVCVCDKVVYARDGLV